MPVITNAEVFWVKCDPRRPVKNYNEDGFEWSLELRTKDKLEAERWERDFHTKVKLREPKEKEKGGSFYVAYLRKVAYLEEEGVDQMRKPVRVVDANLEPLDPNIVGNGSIANIQVRFREWTFKKNKGTKADLVGIQVTRLIPYVPEIDEFEETDMVIVDSGNHEPAAGNADDEADIY
jgi:hypothetical protein